MKKTNTLNIFYIYNSEVGISAKGRRNCHIFACSCFASRSALTHSLARSQLYI